MRYTIYLDVLFLINFGMNAWILWITGKICKRRLIWWRQLVAALTGAFGVIVLMWLPISGGWTYALLGYGVLGFLMCRLALSPENIREAVKTYLCMLMVTFLLGGIMNWLYLETGFGSYINRLCMESGLGIRGLTILVLTGGGILSILGLGAAEIREENNRLSYRVTLYYGDKKIQGRGLVDTGNFLTEPLTHRPVALAEAGFICPILPEEYRQLVVYYLEQGEIDYGRIASQALTGARLIPYSSVGNERGEMLAVTCTKMILERQKQRIVRQNVIVGVSPTPIMGGRQYQILLHMDMIEWEEPICCR